MWTNYKMNMLLMCMSSLFAIHKQNMHFHILRRFVWMEKGAIGKEDRNGRETRASKGESNPNFGWGKDPTHSGPRNTLLLRHAGRISRNCGALLLFKKGVKSIVFFFHKRCGFFRHNPNLHAYPKDWALLKK